AGAIARKSGKEAAADEYFREALALAIEAVNQAAEGGSTSARLNILRTTALLALECGDVTETRRLIDEAATLDPSTIYADEWAQLRDIAAWTDSWLIAAVRREPPDEAALNLLVDRYWRALFGRCQVLTVDREKALDLAQESWRRMLRARNSLKPGGNFPAYLTTIATNAWRDVHRSARRAGPLAEERLASLDAPLPGEGDETIVLADVLPDLNALSANKQRLLAMDIDRALEQLTPLLRDVIVARFITGESCAEIGRRFNRTEQTVSGWVREAVRIMKGYLEEPDTPPDKKS
ncbi:MAG TPA: sigma-70 family RNA polymerase sigma factor, partial [Candidatus Binatia bacterium]|nr:sigma-70 family RNA polymerase sigma factor [Candidatus Binatia bacterium]